MLGQIFNNFFKETDDSLLVLSAFDCFVFPEINPDCILLGNSKLSLSGCDLSTVSRCSKTLHPELYYFYRALEDIQTRSKVAMFFEMKDCWKARAHSLVVRETNDKQRQVRELPVLMTEFCSFFEYKNCKFQNESSFPGFLSGCSRILKDAFVYSLNIAANDNGYGHYFDVGDFKRLADAFIHSLGIFCTNRFKNVSSKDTYAENSKESSRYR